MKCPACQTRDSIVLETRESNEGTADRRRHQCVNGHRWTTLAMMIGSVSNATRSVAKTLQKAFRSVSKKPPDTTDSVPPSRGVGGPLPGVSLNSPKITAEPDLQASSKPSGGRARNKPQANDGSHVRCREWFVRQWEQAYGEKYPFEPKDGTSLANMLSEHPAYGGPVLWESMVKRYLADEFWGRKRHPLIGLATKAREFAGARTNATRSAPARSDGNIETISDWLDRSHG